MRTTLLAVALLLVACRSRDDAAPPPAAGEAATVLPGPDAVVLRVARAGGLVRAYRYPGLDSVVWRSAEPLPAVGRLLGFDPEQGSLVGVSAAGAPLRVDLRVGRVEVSRLGPAEEAATADGGALFVRAGSELVRVTATGQDWSVRTRPGARLFPHADGTVLVAWAADGGTRLVRLRPPGGAIEDSAAVEDVTPAGGVAVGDRLYLAGDERVVGLRTRTLETEIEAGIGDSVIAMAATPSGDRVLVVAAGSTELSIVDRFAGKVTERVTLPGEARDLRIDPYGRLALVRPLVGDSAWLVSLADGSVLGTVGTGWREDLPFVGADDRVALLRGGDVVFARLDGLADQATIVGGASDYWFPIRWNGFRPRAAGLDAPVRFRAGTMRDSLADSAGLATDSAGVPLAPADSGPPPAAAEAPAPEPPLPTPGSGRFYVVLGSVRDERAARDSAARTLVAGARARVLDARSAGGVVHLIVIGPYAARADADRVRRVAGARAWVTEEQP